MVRQLLMGFKTEKCLKKADYIISLCNSIDLHRVVLFSGGYSHWFPLLSWTIKIWIIIFTLTWNASTSFTVNYVITINGRTTLQLHFMTLYLIFMRLHIGAKILAIETCSFASPMKKTLRFEQKILHRWWSITKTEFFGPNFVSNKYTTRHLFSQYTCKRISIYQHFNIHM